jgi:hypothetical protein
VRNALANEEPTINCDIDDDDYSSKHELDFSGEAGRIDDCQEIVLNEALRVARLARLDTKVVFQVREWANATCEFNEEAPYGDWKMNNEDPAPPRRDYGTQKDEQDERQMEQENAVGSQSEGHRKEAQTELTRVFRTLNHYGLSSLSSSHHLASKPDKDQYCDICAHDYTFSIHRDLHSAWLAPIQLNVVLCGGPARCYTKYAACGLSAPTQGWVA